MPTTTLLALSPGTQLTGLATFRGGELVDWQVHGFAGPWQPRKQKLIRHYLDGCLRTAQPAAVVVRLPLLVPPALQWMLDTIRELAARNRVPVYGIPLFLLKERYAATGLNRGALQQEILRREPELLAALPPQVRRKEYYSKLIEAVGVGRAYLATLDPPQK